MDISVKVVVNAKRNFLKQELGRYKIYLTSPAVDGKANRALIHFLAEHFQVKKSCISILQGVKSREKIVRVEE